MSKHTHIKELWNDYLLVLPSSMLMARDQLKLKSYWYIHVKMALYIDLIADYSRWFMDPSNPWLMNSFLYSHILGWHKRICAVHGNFNPALCLFYQVFINTKWTEVAWFTNISYLTFQHLIGSGNQNPMPSICRLLLKEHSHVHWYRNT